MRKLILGTTLFGIVLTFNGACAGPSGQKETTGSGAATVQSRVAPDFRVMGSDGKWYTLDGLVKNGPVFLYFMNDACPVNARAVKYYDSLYKAYAGKVNFFGVINRGEDGYRGWQNRFHVSFPVLLDKDEKIIGSYNVPRSPWIIEVNSKRAIVNVWPGFSVSHLKGLNMVMAKAAGVPPKGVDFSGVPSRTVYG